MKWFQGSIAEAVAASKSKKAIFVVFVEGKDDVSKGIAETINSAKVSERLESEKFVAIKLQSDSENYTFFAQIYQLVPVPSIFFIGENGTPLEIIGNQLSVSDLTSKIDSILLKLNSQTINSSANLINAEQRAHSSNNNKEINKIEDKVNNDIVASDSGQTSDNLSSSNDASTSKTSATEQVTSEPSQEEKIRRARKLIELQNKKKTEEEEEKERAKEIERRKMGKDVQKLRQQQQDREIKEAHEKRLKEKADDAAAKEKILRQIAEDKLERKRKYEINLQEKAAQQNKAKDEAQMQAQETPFNNMTKTRIQFKLPTGNSITGTFEASNTLSSLRTYVIQNVKLPFQQFSMSSSFPRKDFTSVDDNKTLLELELVPSSVILILPIKSSTPGSVIKSTDGAGIFSHFFWTLLAPVVSIYNYVIGYFTGRSRGDNNADGNENRNTGNTVNENANLIFGRGVNITSRMGNNGTTKIRSRGNIHTLHSGDNDNDENNTWNGNSTQQM